MSVSAVDRCLLVSVVVAEPVCERSSHSHPRAGRQRVGASAARPPPPPTRWRRRAGVAVAAGGERDALLRVAPSRRSGVGVGAGEGGSPLLRLRQPARRSEHATFTAYDLLLAVICYNSQLK